MPYQVGDQWDGRPEPEYEIIDDPDGHLRTRGCLVCSGAMTVDGKPCPRCFDPSRYDVAEDAVPRQDEDGQWFGSVARIEDVPVKILRPWKDLIGK